MGIPHFLCIPFPLLGHVNPLMQFSHVLARHGCKVTFLHTEFNHKGSNTNVEGSKIKVVTLPDGLENDDDRSDMLRVLLSIKRTMPSLLPKLIEDVNASDSENNISSILVTTNMSWALEIGHRLGIKGALFSPTSATSLASGILVQRLIDDGIIDSSGLPTRKQEIELSPGIPMIDTAQFPWRGVSKVWFTGIIKEMETIKAASSSLWQEDTTCLQWLDQQPTRSVVYVSFGSLAALESNQFKELALALDLIDKPFLWVVRANDNNIITSSYRKGKIVSWAPQKMILNHPAIACFVTHCGWNSTLEGVCGGVPFLCWPFNSDQFINKRYICDVWKVGLEMEKDEN
ncbi:hypothetical protein PIB30_008509 [Stylosanthes scabra]|uniref:UDP-glycosyltransferase 83A1 n=1 Tax=Stylosanthes scabra TaxID=79078 RepID=A0ABU6Z4M3_9FABA|nr:hypothetical protein [Stylosanthes scabra]